SLREKFSTMVAKTAFKHIELEKDRTQTMLDMAEELELQFSMSSHPSFFVQIPLTGYLKNHFKENFMKIVNQHIDKGQIFLHGNEFARLLQETIFDKVYYSMPVEISKLPEIFKSVAKQLSEQLKTRERKEFDEILKEKVDTNAFPPCMQAIYDALLAGKNVPHMSRFVFATFAVAVGMPTEAIIQLYAKTPNFNEKVTRYHVENISGKKGSKKRYSPPSREKIISYGLCPNTSVCEGYSHPVQWYKQHLGKKEIEKSEGVKNA
ncbi:MAG: hypothetical protein Q7K42_02045, partial [Candidatus Diapherotrites archaeon]|nr:hypothetical protein [Candidatus Diapherotrites archaeon]